MKVEDFVKLLEADFYAGVPDSLLRPFCDYLYSTYGVDGKHHIVAANEGNAAALGVGYYLATGKIPVIYLQNSGTGNIINPLVSLLAKELYGIPAVFVIGWRGEPGENDEPQHIMQGKITCDLLKLLKVSYTVVSPETTLSELKSELEEMRQILAQGGQTAIVIRKGALVNSVKAVYGNANPLARETAIQNILQAAGTDIIVSTTGKASRELFECREQRGEEHNRDFLTVGSMGHSSSVALGIALQKPKRKIWCIDGDGASLMHMGAMAVVGSQQPSNFIHVILDNEAHESVGGMPTASRGIDFCQIGRGCGYQFVHMAGDLPELQRGLQMLNHEQGLRLLVVKTAVGSREGLGRPTVSLQENKRMLMAELAR